MDELLDVLVHELSDDALVAYVQRCRTLSASAQTRHAALRKESVDVHGGERPKTKKSNVNAALAMLMSKTKSQ